MIRILFIDSVHLSLQEKLEKSGFQCDAGYKWELTEIEKNIHQYEGIIIRSRIKIDKALIDKASQLKFIARAGAGMENIDVSYAESKGIHCIHAPEGNRDAVGEHAIGMILALFNNLCKANQEIREGKWIREKNRGIELMNKTIGIIGYGNMGSAFAKRLKGFDVKVIAYDKYKKNYSDDCVTESSLQKLFEETDVLSLHVPLTNETHFMVDDLFINNFRKNIYLINTARGKILKTDDLVKNIKSGKVSGACLDVLEYEAVSFEDIENTEFAEAFNYLKESYKVLLSPHIGGWTHESNEKIAEILAWKINEFAATITKKDIDV